MKLQTCERMTPNLPVPFLASWQYNTFLSGIMMLSYELARNPDRWLQDNSSNASDHIKGSTYYTLYNSCLLAPRIRPGNRPNIVLWEILLPGFWWKTVVKKCFANLSDNCLTYSVLWLFGWPLAWCLLCARSTRSWYCVISLLGGLTPVGSGGNNR